MAIQSKNESIDDQQPGPSQKPQSQTKTQQNNTTNAGKMPKWFKPL